MLAAEMKTADLDSDGRIDFREFIMYFERLARWRAQQARAGRLNARQNSAVPPGEATCFMLTCHLQSPLHKLGALQSPFHKVGADKWAGEEHAGPHLRPVA